jgi:hypothetical protein
VAGKMIVHDAFIEQRLGEVSGVVEWIIRLALAGGIVLVGWLTARRRALAPRQATES